MKKVWTEKEDISLFTLYKENGAKWSLIVKEFPGRTRNEIKNRFYSTLRRVATKKNQGNTISLNCRRRGLLQHIDDAIKFGHDCSSKRGRKRKHPMNIKTKTMVVKETDIGSDLHVQTAVHYTISATSPVSEELPNTFEELMKEIRTMNLVREKMGLALGNLGSAFVPFKKPINL